MTRVLAATMLLLAIASMVRADAAPPPRGVAFGARAEPWWTEQESGWLGGLVGGSIGIFGAVFGVTAGLGKARSFVLAMALVSCGVGILMLIIGTIAVAIGQPYHVYFLFFIIGGVLAFVMGLNYPVLKRRYDQLEFQRMSAMDS